MNLLDPFGAAIEDYHNGILQSPLLIHNTYGEPDEMPVSWYFRDFAMMPDLEQYALSLCSGKVLDIGAGVGIHSLVLQDRAIDVTAIELNTTVAHIANSRGVSEVINGDFLHEPLGKFDTLLLLMNGIGLAGKLENLGNVLNRFHELLEPGGQVIFDSSDITYLYEGEKFPNDYYYGELTYSFDYKGVNGPKFSWVYVDKQRMTEIATKNNFEFQLLYEDEYDHYLARLTAK